MCGGLVHVYRERNMNFNDDRTQFYLQQPITEAWLLHTHVKHRSTLQITLPLVMCVCLNMSLRRVFSTQTKSSNYHQILLKAQHHLSLISVLIYRYSYETLSFVKYNMDILAASKTQVLCIYSNRNLKYLYSHYFIFNPQYIFIDYFRSLKLILKPRQNHF